MPTIGHGLRQHLVVALCVLSLLGLCAPLPAQIADVRDRYRTRSLEAALRIDKGIALVDARKYVDALREFDAAAACDPECQMAHCWRGDVLVALGRVNEGVSAYGRAFDLDVALLSGVGLKAANSASKILAKVGKDTEADGWLARAVMADPNNSAGMLAQAWRSLALRYRAGDRNFAAAVAMVNAAAVDPAGTPPDTLRVWGKAVPKSDDTARLLPTPGAVTAFADRGAGEIFPVPIQGVASIQGRVRQILPDPKNSLLVVIVANERWYYIIAVDKRLTVRKIDLPARAVVGAVANGRLYLACREPGDLYVLDAPSGKVESRVDLEGVPADSVAPFPSRGIVYTAEADAGRVWRVDLKANSLKDTKVFGQSVASEPAEQYLFVTASPAPPAWQPLNIYLGGPGESPTTLLKYVHARGELVLAEARRGVSGQGADLQTSSDGRWVSVLGQFGLVSFPGKRPAGSTPVGLFSAHDLSDLRAVLPSQGFPGAVAVNPVTGQVVMVGARKVSVFQLENRSRDFTEDDQDPEGGVLLSGNFLPVAAWSGDGRYLVVKERGGFHAFANKLSEAETKLGEEWWKHPAPRAEEAEAHGAPITASGPLKGLESFKALTGRDNVKEEIDHVVASGREARIASWRLCGEYRLDEEALRLCDKLNTGGGSPTDDGLIVFRAREFLKAHRDAEWARLYLGQALRRIGMTEEARQALTECVRADAGRSDLTTLALDALSEAYLDDKLELPALYCLAVSLQADRGNARMLQRADELLRAGGFQAEAAKLASLHSDVSGVITSLPRLAYASPDATALSPDRLFERTAPSVVLVRGPEVSTAHGETEATERVYGTAFCIGGPGILLTNNHVVGRADRIDAYPFRIEGGKLVKMEKLSGDVIARWKDRDLALVWVRNAPATMVPLELSRGSPRPGEKVYAVGNPAVASEILEQTISSGILSARGRLIDGQEYLQHTAAVNPGNSGGPLLNDRGQVVGVVTLKAGLEGVSFAVPAEEIRRLFPKPPEAKP